MRISDWSSDVCSSDLPRIGFRGPAPATGEGELAKREAPALRREGHTAVRGSLDVRAGGPAPHLAQAHPAGAAADGRPGAGPMALPDRKASCRERVCQYV